MSPRWLHESLFVSLLAMIELISNQYMSSDNYKIKVYLLPFFEPMLFVWLFRGKV